jgi:menaquinone-dependent protoporphyrinogen oxidase
MPQILIVHASSHGHTAKIAARVRESLEAEGLGVESVDVASGVDVDVRAFEAIVAGGSIHGGRHQRALVEWARRHALALNARPSAFFSVCLAVADGSGRSRAQAQEWIDDFQDDTGWTPTLSTTFAGALQYGEYDSATRLVMRLMMARGGHPTDTRRDVDYTDWDAVDAFAGAVAALVPVRVGAA